MAKDYDRGSGISVPELRRGGYVARALARAEMAAALDLRSQVFRKGQPDEDRFDALCDHFVVAPDGGGAAVCAFRLLTLDSGRNATQSYSGQRYDLARFAAMPTPVLELGRFCVAPGAADAVILQLAWAMLAAMVDRTGAGMLMGCSSFAGTDPAPYRAGFDLLAQAHLAPAPLAPGRMSAEFHDFARTARPVADRRAALGTLPSLLRSYLGLGGWVSDHAVIDRDLHTLHVFTALETAKVPAVRARALRALAHGNPERSAS